VTHIVDKHPGYADAIEDINALMPNCRFVHLIRDGRDVACSMVAAKRTMGFGAASVLGSAQSWQSHVAKCRKAAQFHGRYLETRYEELVADTPRVLETVFSFCGLPYDRQMILKIADDCAFARLRERQELGDPTVKTKREHYRQGKSGGWQNELRMRDKLVFDKFAGMLLCELGYAEANWWARNAASRAACLVWYYLYFRSLLPGLKHLHEGFLKWRAGLGGESLLPRDH
jgi:hypothetical protein